MAEMDLQAQIADLNAKIAAAEAEEAAPVAAAGVARGRWESLTAQMRLLQGEINVARVDALKKSQEVDALRLQTGVAALRRKRLELLAQAEATAPVPDSPPADVPVVPQPS